MVGPALVPPARCGSAAKVYINVEHVPEGLYVKGVGAVAGSVERVVEVGQGALRRVTGEVVLNFGELRYDEVRRMLYTRSSENAKKRKFTPT